MTIIRETIDHIFKLSNSVEDEVCLIDIMEIWPAPWGEQSPVHETIRNAITQEVGDE